MKVPLAFWLLVVGRTLVKARKRGDFAWILPVILFSFLFAAMLGSKRNYGLRYLLPLAGPAIVWVSPHGRGGGKRARWLCGLGLFGMGLALASIHPHELSFYNAIGGGPIGGRKIPGRLQPRLGPRGEVAGEAAAQAAGISRPHPLLFWGHRSGPLRGGRGVASCSTPITYPRACRRD